jgi:hypothetical protein
MLIIDANPFLTGGPEFHPDAVHRINIDTDGDRYVDAAFTLTYSEPKDGIENATEYNATGSQARQPEPAGDVLTEATAVGFDATAQPVQAGRCRLFIGARSDPFFADVEGALTLGRRSPPPTWRLCARSTAVAGPTRRPEPS